MKGFMVTKYSTSMYILKVVFILYILYGNFMTIKSYVMLLLVEQNTSWTSAVLEFPSFWLWKGETASNHQMIKNACVYYIIQTSIEINKITKEEICVKFVKRILLPVCCISSERNGFCFVIINWLPWKVLHTIHIQKIKQWRNVAINDINPFSFVVTRQN